jgi:hypothetical protein
MSLQSPVSFDLGLNDNEQKNTSPADSKMDSALLQQLCHAQEKILALQ